LSNFICGQKNTKNLLLKELHGDLMTQDLVAAQNKSSGAEESSIFWPYSEKKKRLDNSNALFVNNCCSVSINSKHYKPHRTEKA